MIKTVMDGNGAAAFVSYAFSELAIVYPITPSSPMAEYVDEQAARGVPNLFGNVPRIVQMQSEAGVAGALHGAITCGTLATSYTCSQGLLLMQPNMYKIAGELLPLVLHVSARSLATHALSIFGDHQDVMACRQTGFAFLCASSVQEVMDFALVAHLATLRASVPFVHFFDGFRTSHEMTTIEKIEYEEMRRLWDASDVEQFRERALTPDKPCLRGSAQNEDIYFQNRERANPYYAALPDIVQGIFAQFAKVCGRQYRLFDYEGDRCAERVIVMMGSGCSVASAVAKHLAGRGERVGVVKVRLYRPFCVAAFLEALPTSCKRIAVLDRTKESGGVGEPLYLDVCAALAEGNRKDIRVIGGRYGLASKDFTPTACFAVWEALRQENPKTHFTVGITDDVSYLSLDTSQPFVLPQKDCVCCKFFGLGSDGTVGANKNAVKIIGKQTDRFVQAYFCYDSRKSGGATISHLRFGKSPISASYLIDDADFIACHNPSYVTRYDLLGDCKVDGTFLLNCPCHTPTEAENFLPNAIKRQIARKRIRFFILDGTKIARETGLSGRTGTIMQAAFFLLNPDLLPYTQAKGYLIDELKTLFAKKGNDVVQRNVDAVERVENAVWEMEYPAAWKDLPIAQDEVGKNDYFERFIRPVLALQGNSLPVSAFTADGSVPVGTSKLEKHGTPPLLPHWIAENCIQCNQCAFVCPHACIRPVLLEQNAYLPPTFLTKAATGIPDTRFRIQVSPHDCMGCSICANTCPTKEKALVMRPSKGEPTSEVENWEFAQSFPQKPPVAFPRTSVKGSQFYPPLFEFSYACAGCGETPYIKLLTQLFGERMLIANATGCSSIYGGSAPTCPYTVNADGKGPAWANSLFEDNAEFGLGMRLAYERNGQTDKSVWIVGGDGWAYDIGFGGLDHILAFGANVNILVLDSEVYSNTGGQCSKATPLGATARFAVGGKGRRKKDLGLMAMTYGDVYVAQVAMGADKAQLVQALHEAERYDGVSLVIAYSPCIAHGVPMQRCMEEERLAVESGHWLLYRYDPTKKERGQNPLSLDSKPPVKSIAEFYERENRFASLKTSDPVAAEALLRRAEEEAREKFALYQKLSTTFSE